MALVYNRPNRKSPAAPSPELEARVLSALQSASQQSVARTLGISQSFVSTIVRRHKETAAATAD